MNNQIGFMQGRLSEIVKDKIQCFPKKNWENEFKIANSIGIKLMEWTIDHEPGFDNPLITKDGQEKIKELSNKYSLSVKSLTGDCFMQMPFWKEDSIDIRSQLINEMVRIFVGCNKVGINLVVIPIVDNGSIENEIQEGILIDTLYSKIDLLNKLKIKIVFESDLHPQKLIKFINKLPMQFFGINYDTGNSASLGFNPQEEFDLYGKRIMNIHLKDRLLNGPTVPISQGNVDFQLIFNLVARNGYGGNFILQTARSNNNKHVELINYYKNLFENYLVDNVV